MCHFPKLPDWVKCQKSANVRRLTRTHLGARPKVVGGCSPNGRSRRLDTGASEAAYATVWCGMFHETKENSHVVKLCTLNFRLGCQSN